MHVSDMHALKCPHKECKGQIQLVHMHDCAARNYESHAYKCTKGVYTHARITVSNVYGHYCAAAAFV